MAYNFSFKDNETYGAEDINNITKRLVTSGVSDVFENGTPYNLLALNDLGAVLYTSGAVPETVNSLKVSRLTEDKLLINPGMAFFADGAVFEVLAGGEEIACSTSAKQYVYLKNDLINSNVCYPACTIEAPTGDYVLLAEINENGEITDKRTYAKGKLPGYSSNSNYVMKIEDTVYFENSSSTVTKTYNIGSNKYNFILAYNGTYGGSANDVYDCTLAVYDISKGTYISLYKNLSGGMAYSNRLDFYCSCNHATYGNAYAQVSISGGVLTLTLRLTNTNSNSNKGLSVPLNLYLF